MKQVKTVIAVLLLSVMSAAQSVIFPPACDPWWDTPDGKALIASYSNMKMCDKRTIHALPKSWKARCVRNYPPDKGNHVELDYEGSTERHAVRPAPCPKPSTTESEKSRTP